MQVKAVKPFPQRAVVDTLSVDEGIADDEVRVEVEVDLVLDLVLDETVGGPLHVPNFKLHPVPQYALVFPQYPY